MKHVKIFENIYIDNNIDIKKVNKHYWKIIELLRIANLRKSLNKDEFDELTKRLKMWFNKNVNE